MYKEKQSLYNLSNLADTPSLFLDFPDHIHILLIFHSNTNKSNNKPIDKKKEIKIIAQIQGYELVKIRQREVETLNSR